MNHTNPLIDLITNVGKAPFAGQNAVANKTATNGIVRVTVKTNYGTKHFYPANGVADLFLAIQGGKTLTPASLRILKNHGYEIEYRYEEVKL